jgi:hypothetical protein
MMVAEPLDDNPEALCFAFTVKTYELPTVSERGGSQSVFGSTDFDASIGLLLSPLRVVSLTSQLKTRVASDELPLHVLIDPDATR